MTPSACPKVPLGSVRSLLLRYSMEPLEIIFSERDILTGFLLNMVSVFKVSSGIE